MARNPKKINLAKLLYQFAVLAALGYMGLRLLFDKVYTPDFEAYCPFGGLQAMGSYISRGSLSCSMTGMQIMMGVMVFVGAVLFSKLFCGYICPYCYRSFYYWLIVFQVLLVQISLSFRCPYKHFQIHLVVCRNYSSVPGIITPWYQNIFYLASSRNNMCRIYS